MHATKAILLAGLGLLTATPAATADNWRRPTVRVRVQPRQRCRLVTRQVWVPARWVEEDRRVQVPGHWETYHRIETVPGYWETYNRIVTTPGRYETRTTHPPRVSRWRAASRRVYVPGRFTKDAYGRQRWVQAHTETRSTRVSQNRRRYPQRTRRWVPNRRQTVTTRRWVPASQRTVQDRRWVPATSRTERTRRCIRGHYEARTEYECKPAYGHRHRAYRQPGRRNRHEEGGRIGRGDLQA